MNRIDDRHFLLVEVRDGDGIARGRTGFVSLNGHGVIRTCWGAAGGERRICVHLHLVVEGYVSAQLRREDQRRRDGAEEIPHHDCSFQETGGRRPPYKNATAVRERISC